MSSLLAAARTKRESGFTLIELLTVIVIIGILAAIAIPVFSSQRQRANDAASVSEARSVLTAIESYAAGQTGGVIGDADSTTAGVQIPANFATVLTSEGATSKTGDNLDTQVTFFTNGYTISTKNIVGKSTKNFASTNISTGVLTAGTDSNLSASFSQRGSVIDFTAATNDTAASAAGVITFS